MLSLLFAVLLSAHGDVQRPTCLPDIPEARNWPIDVIYLHGLFAGYGADTNGFRVLEQQNREKLTELAVRRRVRIAVPVAPYYSSAWRQWNYTTLAQMEQMAVNACDGTHLARERSIVGFSNGGYFARRIGLIADCSQTDSYRKILAIGAPEGTRAGACGNLVNRSPHQLDIPFIEDQLF